VQPTSPGYTTWVAEPVLGGLQWMEGKVPTPHGDIQVYCSTRQIKIKGAMGTGTLRFKSQSKPSSKSGAIVSKGNNVYEMTIETGKDYEVKYKAL
jgi:hypothetical protein